MNPFAQNELPNDSAAASSAAEETLRLIASLPAPEGLEDRLQVSLRAGLRAAPRSARILAWPVALHPSSGLMRSAAAAAIAFVVAGGGWGVYSRVQSGQPAGVVVLPPRVSASGGFSSAGAMRTPQTLNGPVVAQPTPSPAPQTNPSFTDPARTVRPHFSPAVISRRFGAVDGASPVFLGGGGGR